MPQQKEESFMNQTETLVKNPLAKLQKSKPQAPVIETKFHMDALDLQRQNQSKAENSHTAVANTLLSPRESNKYPELSPVSKILEI